MLLQLQSLFTGEKPVLPLDVQLDFSGLEWNGETPFREPVSVQGEIRHNAGVVTLSAVVRYTYDGTCDRCARDIHCEEQLQMEHTLVVSLNHEDNESFVLLDNYRLPLDELVQEDLLLEQPLKRLCSEECRGLCPTCGQDLNEGNCSCVHKTVDPRLAALQQLLDG
jgi:uncharacterized protein